MDNKFKTVCFTGKRPQSMPWRFNESDKRCVELKASIKREIENTIKGGYVLFVSGMALGVDTWAAEIVLEFKKDYNHIRLEAALPCETQSEKWNAKDRERYFDILSLCDTVTYVSNKYTPSCMIKRNHYMVNKSDLLIAVYNGTGGGTGATIEYARKKNIEIRIINF